MNKTTDLSSKSKLPSGLYIVATPIGNLGDITFRAIETLKRVDMIYCEDRRQSSVLLSHYNIQTALGSYHEHNGPMMRPIILDQLREAKSIALISDAGTPLISDPGYKLVNACREEGLPVIPIPGPSAPITALSASGMPSDHFYFGGFLPSKSAEKMSHLEKMEGFTHTQIYFESPHRLLETLGAIKLIYGERVVCVARELTKTFETISYGPVSDVIEYYNTEGVLKGEIVLLIKGCENGEPEVTSAIHKALSLLQNQLSTKETSELLSELTGVPKKILYKEALAIKERS